MINQSCLNMNKLFAESCEQNQTPILSVIQPLFADCTALLEIGSGTGQHAVFFAGKMPHLNWFASDCKEHLQGISLWLNEAGLNNIHGPILLDVTQPEWPDLDINAVFSANTVHIMHWYAVEHMFSEIGKLLPEGGKFVLYGPFNYNGQYTSDSNARFDNWLKSRDPASGIRNFEDLDKLAREAGMFLRQDYAMPANNRILYWQKC